MVSKHRVSRTPSALYSTPRTIRKRRRCGGHLSDPHWIEVGEQAVWSSLPPHSDIGNEGWWHAVFCMNCAPIECVTSDPAPEDCGVVDCGEVRCDRCGERMTCTGPEPRACGTTCADCPCSCTSCLQVREELRADVERLVAKEVGR